MPTSERVTSYAVVGIDGFIRRSGECDVAVVELQATEPGDEVIWPLEPEISDLSHWWNGTGWVPLPPRPEAPHYWREGGWAIIPAAPNAFAQFDEAEGVWIDPRPAAEIEAEQIAELRRERDRRLAASDWTQMPDAPLSPTLREAWRIYRQALRDMPDTQDPAAPEWPPIPTEDNP